ncbi:MAG: cysteine desulfurase NifS [Candidatus Omnitrophota bacterium]
MKKIYLDYAATTPTDPEALKVMLPYFCDKFGNASSVHCFGQEAKRALEESRLKIALSLGADTSEIIFTSGGTESNNFALFGVADALVNKGNHIIISSIEHHAITEPAKFLEKKGFNITRLRVDRYGVVDPLDVKKAITDRTILVSIMQANNEIGTLQPIKEISKIIKEKNIYFHTDAVQSVGHIPVNVADLGVDLLSLSGHKFYGPKGVGALYVKHGTKITRFLHGGDQERMRRASTENIAGVVGMASALEICQAKMKEEMKLQAELRDKLIKGIIEKIDDIILNGHPTNRLANNINFSFKYIEGESILLNLDLEGIAASTGSACTSDSLEPSSVLLAVGQAQEDAHGSIRFSLGRWTSEAEIDYVLEKLPKIVAKLRAMSPIYNKKG